MLTFPNDSISKQNNDLLIDKSSFNKWETFYQDPNFKINDFELYENRLMTIDYQASIIKIANLNNPNKTTALLDLKKEKMFVKSLLPTNLGSFFMTDFIGYPAFCSLGYIPNLRYAVVTIHEGKLGRTNTDIKPIPMKYQTNPPKFLPELVFIGKEKELITTVRKHFDLVSRKNKIAKQSTILTLRAKDLSIIKTVEIDNDLIPITIKNQTYFFHPVQGILYDVDLNKTYRIPENFPMIAFKKIYYDSFNREVIFAFEQKNINYLFYKVDVSNDAFSFPEIAYNSEIPKIFEKGSAFSLDSENSQIKIFESFNWSPIQTFYRFTIKKDFVSENDNSFNTNKKFVNRNHFFGPKTYLVQQKQYDYKVLEY